MFLVISVGAQETSSLIINNILVKPKPENVSYEVQVYISVLDSAKVPIKDLKVENFTVIEDSNSMSIESLTTANDPISFVMALDTSGSMNGAAIKSAKDAVNSFLLGMDNEDQVGILTFNTNIQPVIDFTKDRQQAGQQLSLVQAVPNSGTCLYNAAYQAVQNVASLPPGRRAVILLTDGVDELPGGGACSTYTIDDVIDLATSGNSIIPIFALGVGNRVDQQSLQRLALLTGGRFQYAPNSDQLGTIFKNLSDQLKSQYLLTYDTTSAQGSHTVVVQVTTLAVGAKDTRNFITPAMPAGILIKSPTDGEAISGQQKISAALTGSATGVEKIVFYVGGTEVGQAATPPYDLDFEFTSTFVGNTTIEVVAQDANGKTIAKQSIVVNVTTPENITGTTPSPSVTSSVQTTTELTSFDNYYVFGGIGLLTLIIVGIIVYVVRKQKSTDSTANSSLGTLEVIFSDDSMFIGRKFEIELPHTRLGRLIDGNDISFPSDDPVSRYHAVIDKKGENLYISEVTVPKPAKYGTYLNEIKLGGTELLHDKDEIRLGNRLKLRVNLSNQSTTETDDNLKIPKELIETMDFSRPRKENTDPYGTQDPD